MQRPTKARGFHADFCFARIEDLPVPWLGALGIRGLLIDVDNTITRWELLEVPEIVMGWLAEVGAAGIQTRLLSNGLAHKRSAVALQTGIAQVAGPLFKPIPAFFRRGLAEMSLAPNEVMMVGDSVFTDIAAANRLGIWTTLLEPLSAVDFAGSKVGRMLELMLRLRRPLHAQHDYRLGGPPIVEAEALHGDDSQ